jgi:hypothetical protein
MKSAARATALAALTTLTALTALLAGAGCIEPQLADLPARCTDSASAGASACPEGLACIHGVCAEPGTPIPITVAELSFLRGRDLRILPQAQTALVTWQTYAYSEEGQRFVGARVSADGVVSREMTLVSSFVANEGATEPFYDILQVAENRLLLAVSAPPLADDPNPQPRLIAYNVTLPPEGQEAQGAQFGSPWASEMRMSTIGYGAVSRPKLIATDTHVELGYFRTLTKLSAMDALETIGELAVIKLDADGAQLPEAPAYYRARDGLPVAVGVDRAFRGSAGVFWVLDDTRPSALFIDDTGAPSEAKLERLSLAVAAEGAALSYIQPSARTGEKLPSGPVAGPASLHRLDYAVGGGGGALTTVKLGDLPIVRDTPRPAWVTRDGKPAILVTPGAEESAAALVVYTVDTASGGAAEVSRIERFGSTPIIAVTAAVVSGKLFVAWADGAETSVIRMAILPEP